jgi:hypothetical protein
MLGATVHGDVACQGLGAPQSLLQVQAPLQPFGWTLELTPFSGACRWTLFFEFAIVCYGLASTLLPNRLPRARYAVAQYLVIATVLIMIALNAGITDVWLFWDHKKMFSDWSGAAQKMYLSSAAAVAGWILTAIFNFIYVSTVRNIASR